MEVARTVFNRFDKDLAVEVFINDGLTLSRGRYSLYREKYGRCLADRNGLVLKYHAAYERE